MSEITKMYKDVDVQRYSKEVYYIFTVLVQIKYICCSAWSTTLYQTECFSIHDKVPFITVRL